MKNIGKRIRNFREERGMTLEELADKLGKSKGYLSKQERGLKPINLESLHQIASVLEVDVTDLFPNKEKTENPFTGDGDWAFVIQELKNKGFTPSEVFLRMAQEEIERKKKGT